LSPFHAFFSAVKYLLDGRRSTAISFPSLQKPSLSPPRVRFFPPPRQRFFSLFHIPFSGCVILIDFFFFSPSNTRGCFPPLSPGFVLAFWSSASPPQRTKYLPSCSFFSCRFREWSTFSFLKKIRAPSPPRALCVTNRNSPPRFFFSHL